MMESIIFSTHLTKKMDCIKLLPDNIANQIAAGEVVQRPASVIKELMENALDAKATNIKVLIKDGGSTLIQIIDNGIGMSTTDARMCWERHATSKINQAEDLFKLRSFGFRGEALASIAAIAHVEMKTKRAEDQVGTFIKIEGSKVVDQTAVATNNGTQFSIKNLFYNVPARRNFLKSMAVEMRHIIDEFIRVAIPHNEISFSLFNNDKEVFILNASSPEIRIAEILGKKNANDFLKVEETHELINVGGFIGKPEIAKRTRGEQYLFVNKRFIKDGYLNHAIVNAFDNLITKDQFPTYVLFLETDPSHIDINIHPTKTEIKFDDERSVYSLVKSAVKKSLGGYASMPELDFENAFIFNSHTTTENPKFGNINVPEPKVNKGFNPFQTEQKTWKSVQNSQWQKIFENEYLSKNLDVRVESAQQKVDINTENIIFYDYFSLPDGYLAAVLSGNLIIVDQRAAHEKILQEKYLQNIQKHTATIQQLLFPRTVELSTTDYQLAHELLDDLKELGFDVADFGNNCMIINGVPSETLKGSEKELFEGIIESFKNNNSDFNTNKKSALALALAQNEAIFRTKTLEKPEIKSLLENLFKCENPSTRENGKPVFIEINQEKIINFFK